MGSLSQGQRKVERRPLAGLTRGPDAAAVAMDDPLDNGQSDAGAGKLRCAVQTVEDLEESVSLLRMKAGTVVRDGEDHLSVGLLAADGDGLGETLAAILEGIAEKIGPDLLNEDPIADRLGEFTNADHVGTFCCLRDVCQGGGHEALHIEGTNSNVGLSDLGQAQNRVDQTLHPAGIGQDRPADPFTLVAEVFRMMVNKGLGHASHDPERRAQVVGSRVGEGLEVALEELAVRDIVQADEHLPFAILEFQRCRGDQEVARDEPGAGLEGEAAFFLVGRLARCERVFDGSPHWADPAHGSLAAAPVSVCVDAVNDFATKKPQEFSPLLTDDLDCGRIDVGGPSRLIDSHHDQRCPVEDRAM